MAEKQTCGRRMSNPGPWAGPFKAEENLDVWDTDRWDSNRRDSVKWNWSWKPRTCSFCGSVHPEDAIKLLKEGWEVETTGKSYKRYLEPPGYRKAMEKLLGNVRQRNLDAKDNPFDNNETWSPTPPAKFYTHHLNEDTLKRFNEAIDEGRKLREGKKNG